LRQFFSRAKAGGAIAESATIDGNPDGLSGLWQKFGPGLIIQRCIVHIQRGKDWCGAELTAKTYRSKKIEGNIFSVNGSANTRTETIISKSGGWLGKSLWKKIESKKETGWCLVTWKEPEACCESSGLTPFISWMIREFLEHQIWRKDISVYEKPLSRHRGLSPKKRANFFNWFFILKP